MKVVSVIPITRGITKEELSYFSTETVHAGDIVSVPLRKKSVPALVTHVTDVRQKKAELRTASFSLRKITQVHTQAPFTPEFMAAVTIATDYFASTTGAVLNTLVPKALLKKPIASPEKKEIPKTEHDVFIFQNEETTRFAYYKSLTRELFAKKQSLAVILPTQRDAETAFETLNRGITEHAVLLHTGLSQKKQHQQWQQALESTHPVLIIATPAFLSLPRRDIGSIVLEYEHSRHYKTNTKPYLDYRTFTRMLAENMNVPLILGDELLRLETQRAYQTHTFTALSPPTMHYGAKVPVSIVDMRNDPDAPQHAFQTISAELYTMLEAMHTPTDRCLIFTIRKGLYPLTVCGDCGHLVTCDHCSAPVVVHGTPQDTSHVFVCHRCNRERSAEERCHNCKSWNLVPLGVGSERVEEELTKTLPDRTILRVDTDTMKPMQIRQTVATWKQEPGSILIGTETVLPYAQHATHSAVASMDTLFALPDFRARERIFRTALFLHNRAAQHLLIQTRNSDDTIFEHIKNSNVLAWYQEELQERKKFSYPPFTTLIKITTAAQQDKLETYINKLEKVLSAYNPKTFPAFTPRVRGTYVVHTLITLPEDVWPDKELTKLLQKLPPHHKIQVDPEHLL